MLNILTYRNLALGVYGFLPAIVRKETGHNNKIRHKKSFYMIARCLCSGALLTGTLLEGNIFLEKVTSTACLVGSGLQDILHLSAQRLINCRS